MEHICIVIVRRHRAANSARQKRSNLEQEQRNWAFDSPNDLMTQLMKREVMRLLAEESDCQRPHMKLFLVIDRIEGKVDEESPDELLLLPIFW